MLVADVISNKDGIGTDRRLIRFDLSSAECSQLPGYLGAVAAAEPCSEATEARLQGADCCL